MAKKPKTTGLEWLALSLASFNGSGYGDRSDPGSFVDSYMAYKQMKNKPQQAQLAYDNFDLAMSIATGLLEGNGPGMVPSDRGWSKFKRYYP
jgi:hypothetical protein